MLALAFLNPLLLWAVPLAAVPIVIHLLNRRRFLKVPWAAMEYLLAAMKRNRKRLRMEQWLVLLLRTLAVLLLVFLVSRPQLGGGGLLRTRTHHVFVLDDTGSTTQRTGSTTLFEKARDRVRAEADRLGETRSGDLYSLVRTSRSQPNDLWAVRVGPDLGTRVGTLLKGWGAGDGTMDLGQTLEAVRKKAAETKEAGATRYHLVTDLRAADWLTEDDKPRPGLLAQLQALQPGELTVIEVGGQHHNVAVVGVRRADRYAVAGVPVTLAVDVQNFGLDAAPPGTVAVEIDGKSQVVRPVPQLAPGERTSVAVTHTFHQAGFHRVDAALPATEHFPFDDKRTLALEVQERSRALLVDGEPDVDGGEAFFLQVALDPGGDAISGIEPQVVLDTALAETDLEQFDLVWLCNVASPSPTVVQKLEAYVAAGGGLAIFCGPQVDGPRWTELFWRDGKGLLPLPLGDVGGDSDRPQHVFLAKKDHELCGNLGEMLEMLFARVVFVKRWVTPIEEPKASASIVARIRDAEGAPLLVTRTFGAGEVVLCATTADKHWSNVPDTYVSVVLANQVHRFAARRRDLAGANLLTRGAYRLALDPGLFKPDVTVRAPGAGAEFTFTAEAKAPPPAPGANAAANANPNAPPANAPPGERPQDGESKQQPLELVVPLDELPSLGAYEVELRQHGGTVEQRLFARNAPLAESRLAGLGSAAFQRIYPKEVHDRVQFVGDAGGLGETTGEGELWRVLAFALLAGLLLESLLAWRFGRR